MMIKHRPLFAALFLLAAVAGVGAAAQVDPASRLAAAGFLSADGSLTAKGRTAVSGLLALENVSEEVPIDEGRMYDESVAENWAKTPANQALFAAYAVDGWQGLSRGDAALVPQGTPEISTRARVYVPRSAYEAVRQSQARTGAGKAISDYVGPCP